MKKIILVSLLATLAALPMTAGGALETTNRTTPVPSPFAGFSLVDVIGIRWDVRSLPVSYSLNTSVDPIPNPLGPAFLTLAEIGPALQSTLDQWNEIPTSYIEMHLTGTTPKTSLRGFDQINEITFLTAGNFAAIASSPSTSFVVDVDLPDGADIDGDGDADVSSAITSAADVDGDGDIEMVAGFYPAGTIIENDVQFNTKASNGFRFTIDDGLADAVTRSVDLECVAVHEFGHSFGLSHSLNNQNAADDGDGATMFPFIDTGDPAAELQQAVIGIDDVSWASYFYPEGSASTGLPAVQAGDVPFSNVYGLIRGEVTHGLLGQPVAGANVFTINRQTGRMGPSGFTGTTRLLRRDSDGACCFFGNAQTDIVDGAYVIPVPKGTWELRIEPVDGDPVPATSISFTTQIGTRYGLMAFNEEAWNNLSEDGVELRPGEGKNVYVNPGTVADGVDFVTTRAANINPYGSRNFVGFTGTAPGSWYAVRIPASSLVIPGWAGADYNVHGALFETFAWDASTTPLFAEALLTTGTLHADGSVSIDLANPLEREAGFLGQDGDFAPLFVKNPHETGRRVRRGLERGDFDSLFLVLRNPLIAPYPGVSGFPPLIGLDDPTTAGEPPTLGQSYVSSDGVSWTEQTRFNFRFSLVLSEP